MPLTRHKHSLFKLPTFQIMCWKYLLCNIHKALCHLMHNSSDLCLPRVPSAVDLLGFSIDLSRNTKCNATGCWLRPIFFYTCPHDKSVNYFLFSSYVLEKFRIYFLCFCSCSAFIFLFESKICVLHCVVLASVLKFKFLIKYKKISWALVFLSMILMNNDNKNALIH